MLHNVHGRFLPYASEGGHADFAARTTRELELVAELTRIFGRVGVERVVSGPGLVNIYQFTHGAFGTGPMITPNSLAPSQLCSGVGQDRTQSELPGRIYTSAIEKRCPRCVEAVDMFISAYGSEAGNLALRALATASYIGGGIAPESCRPSNRDSSSRHSGPRNRMADLVAMVPVVVILNPDAGLLGAAVRAMALAAER